MDHHALGDLDISGIGLGCMPLSQPGLLPDRPRALATVHAALDAGVTLLDTADIYAPDGERFGHNEELVGEAIRTWGSAAERARVVVATKGGITRRPGPDGDMWGRDASPHGLARAARASARRLGVDVIDLYFLHRLDPSVCFDEQVGGLAQVKADGIARHIGLSNVNLAQLDRALQLVGGPGEGGVVAVQNEYSPRYRQDANVLERCVERGVVFLPWSPLGGASQASELGSRYAAFAQVADARGVSAQEVTLAWLRGLGPGVIPIPGSTRPETARSSAAAAGLALTDEQMRRLSATSPENTSVFPDDTPPPPM
ncbi:aldo/keto reductase [Enhygromyxa salina]|uniref:Putative oxidoreductase YdbC n=1 Tax=Enhygromyxa salina TaxID=215803 RepID=A0A2S9YSQ1_9BACT|nr:aldo/keto reductase [Enhygromyxa salina]PRQ08127.1 putative oxidoreductase YdbC [Enhygromyxa salina]